MAMKAVGIGGSRRPANSSSAPERTDDGDGDGNGNGNDDGYRLQGCRCAQKSIRQLLASFSFMLPFFLVSPMLMKFQFTSRDRNGTDRRVNRNSKTSNWSAAASALVSLSEAEGGRGDEDRAAVNVGRWSLEWPSIAAASHRPTPLSAVVVHSFTHQQRLPLLISDDPSPDQPELNS
ncbi:unnamed protein product [Soboliphyme baturini]|uniref:Uncharacterized protein n=1 Tax=Soboliphyme baturini TaxID=241478 RepID=A0A183ILT4_9BILA|nr:unnamed protein product [Soboliphyme baturini]